MNSRMDLWAALGAAELQDDRRLVDNSSYIAFTIVQLQMWPQSLPKSSLAIETRPMPKDAVPVLPQLLLEQMDLFPSVLCHDWQTRKKEELHQSSQRRLIRRNTNTRIEYPSTNLETVINVAYDQKKVGLPNKSTQSPQECRHVWLVQMYDPDIRIATVQIYQEDLVIQKYRSRKKISSAATVRVSAVLGPRQIHPHKRFARESAQKQELAALTCLKSHLLKQPAWGEQ
jgi:hypothetical protein